MTSRMLHWIGRADSPKHASTGGGPGDGVAPVCIGEIEGPLRAEIARTYLEQAGVAVFLQAEAVGSVYGFVSGPLALVRVFVPLAQAEEARRIFAELDFGDDAAEPED